MTSDASMSLTGDDPALAEQIGPELLGALAERGFTELTAVQRAVLDPALAGRDLRVTSQTGSGKTVAIGLVVQGAVRDHVAARGGRADSARPAVIVIAPTRELAQQVAQELSWLLAPLGAKVVSVTGGSSYVVEGRALSAGPAVVVGTPGRLLDHLDKKSIDARTCTTFVLDEADRMLDMGFREELEAIFAHAPTERTTHLMSATFPRDVIALADRLQQNAAHVQGTRLGAANTDIEHVIHLIEDADRQQALVNLLLAEPEARTLIFSRTRAGVGRVATELSRLGFDVAAMSGEMEQGARNRTLAGFRSGKVRVLIATDVAARGIDVPDIDHVIHAVPPTNPDTYTHRSGRTGRAGRKGKSTLLVCKPELPRVLSLLSRARVPHRFEPVPSPAEIARRLDTRLLTALSAPPAEDGEPSDAHLPLAKRLADGPDLVRTLARLLARAGHRGPTQAAEVRSLPSPRERDDRRRDRDGRDERSPPRARRDERGPHSARDERAPRMHRPAAYVPFRVTWGEAHGADPRRLMAVVCRRGRVGREDIGQIQVGLQWSVVEIASDVAEAFAAAAALPDSRDPKTKIRRLSATSKIRTGNRKDAPAKPVTRDRPREAPTGPVPKRRPRTGAARPPKRKHDKQRS